MTKKNYIYYTFDTLGRSEDSPRRTKDEEKKLKKLRKSLKTKLKVYEVVLRKRDKPDSAIVEAESITQIKELLNNQRIYSVTYLKGASYKSKDDRHYYGLKNKPFVNWN
jgi:hypothetical protein